MPDAKNIVGSKVAKIRNCQGLSQAQLAAKCQRLGWDVGRDTIAKIEGGKRCVIDSEVVKLAKVLKVSFLDLLS